MQTPPLTPDEPYRLEALRSMDILDTSLEERFERLTRLLKRALRVPISAISLVDSDRQWFKSIQGLACDQTSRDVSFCGYTILDDSVMVVEDARVDSRFAQNPLVTGAPYIVAYAGCPLKGPDGSRVGTMCAIDTSPRKFCEEDLTALRDLAALAQEELCANVSNAVQHELLEQIQQERRRALVDSLTRIWNREGVMNELEEACSEARDRKTTPPVVMLADIDFFKKVNDNHGHLVGDYVLRGAAKRFLGAIRSCDTVGRYGGEEFLFVMPGVTEMDVAAEIAERVRSALSERTVLEGLNVTTSLGMVIPEPGWWPDVHELIAAADAQLYRAKVAGRDRVCWQSVPSGACSASAA